MFRAIDYFRFHVLQCDNDFPNLGLNTHNMQLACTGL
jgi:hypothetical protein